MRNILRISILCLVAVPGLWAAPGAVRCGKLVDVRTGKVLTDQTIAFDEKGTITAIGATNTIAVPQGTIPIDLSAATCLPGLIDVHTHLTSDPKDSGYAGLGVSVPREAITGAKNANKTLLAGFTTVRNVGAGNFTDVALRDGINEGDVPGPRMLVSGPPLGITGGHCDNNLLPYEFHYKEAGVADGPLGGARKGP
jgi:imidazolonepropionase-like amidohydrolase